MKHKDIILKRISVKNIFMHFHLYDVYVDSYKVGKIFDSNVYYSLSIGGECPDSILLDHSDFESGVEEFYSKKLFCTCKIKKELDA